MSLPAKHFYIIRHGQSEANAARILAGHLDSPLTELGRQQADKARRIVEKLDKKPTNIVHSHLSRARETAEIINTNLNLPIHEDSDLSEKNCGTMEGKPYEECLDEFYKWLDIKEGDTANDFIKRVKRGKTRALVQFTEPVLISCHGGVMRALGAIYGLMDVNNFKNAHLYEFIPNSKKINFPFDVYEYELCEKSEKLIREVSKQYSEEINS